MNLNCDEKNIAQDEFTRKLTEYIYKEKIKNNCLDIVFLCIGTDRIVGDSFGPLVGTKLKELLEQYNIYNINVYGTLKQNICYTNIKEYLKMINERHPNACVIVIDAALSEEKNIGKVFVENRKMFIGNGLNKSKIEVGDISIKAVVGRNYKFSKYNFVSLKNSSLNMVIKLSEIVSKGIYNVLKYEV